MNREQFLGMQNETEIPLCAWSNLVGKPERFVTEEFNITITHTHDPRSNMDAAEPYDPNKIILNGMRLHIVGKQRDIEDLMDYAL